jgi:hypothetical protein
MNGKLNGIGVIAGAIGWVGIILYSTSQVQCVRIYYDYACGSSDLFVSSIMGVGMLAPAYFIAYIVSTFFDGS